MAKLTQKQRAKYRKQREDYVEEIQSWFTENTIEDEVARKIFSAANQILKAGVKS